MKKSALAQRIEAARDGKPTFVLKNARVVNVFSGEILRGDAALFENTIIGVGRYDCENSFDCGGAYLCPGFIDSHVHIESSMSCPAQFARIVLPFGTTSVVADPHEIANVCGMRGIRYMKEASQNIGLDVRYMFPSCVPCAEGEENKAPLTNEDAAALFYEQTVDGLGEVMDWGAVVECRDDMVKKLALFQNMPIDGHAPGLSGNALNAYVVGGPKTDHEAYAYDEIMEKLRAGMYVQLRVGSAANNMAGVMKKLAENKVPLDRFLLCTDDKHTENILAEGHINYIAKLAVAAGISPIDAVRMAGLNAARAYGFHRKGAVAPGYDADLVLFRDLQSFEPLEVFVGGKNIKEVGISDIPAPEKLTGTMRFAPLRKHSLDLPVPEGGTLPVIEMGEGQLTTALTFERVPQAGGLFAPAGGYAKLAVIERHHRTGHIGLGVVKNFGLRAGAFASSVAHDSHNLVVMGINDADMRLAADMLKRQGGGYALAAGGKALAAIPLPVGGLMSCAPYEELVETQKNFLAGLAKLGVPQASDPLIRLSFFSLPVIPAARVTTKGVYDVGKGKYI